MMVRLVAVGASMHEGIWESCELGIVGVPRRWASEGWPGGHRGRPSMINGVVPNCGGRPHMLDLMLWTQWWDKFGALTLVRSTVEKASKKSSRQ